MNQPSDASTPPRDAHRLAVGACAQRIVAETLRSPTARPSPIELTNIARRVFVKHPVSYRSRESLLEAVTAAGVYLHRLRPDGDWEFIGAEQTHGDCRFDLVWEHPRYGHLVDELKLGVGRGGELAVRAQIDRYLEVGAGLWPHFVGVRLCAVHEPGMSRLYRPGRRRSDLVSESELVAELAPR